jgi:hypothetical protein
MVASLRPALPKLEPWPVLSLVELLLDLDDSEAMKHDVLQTLRPHAAHYLTWKEGASTDRFLDLIVRCDAGEEMAPSLLKLTRDEGIDNSVLIAHLKGMCVPPVPLTPKEFLETKVLERLPGLLNGLLDVQRFDLSSEKETFPDNDREPPLFWGEHRRFLLEHREFVTEYALEKLQSEGDPYAALMLAYLKDQRALPFLHFWYLHAGSDDYCFEGVPSLHFHQESFQWRYAYERSICHLTGKSLELSIKLEPHERTWLLRRLRSWFSPMVPEGHSIEAYLLWRLDQELARDELCRRFREDRTGAFRALVANGILDYLIENVKTKQDLLALLGKPDSESVEHDCGDPGREFLAKAEQWTDRYVYLFPYSEESIQSKHAAICFYFRDDLLVNTCRVSSGRNPDKADTLTLIYLKPKSMPSEDLIWEGLWSDSDTVIDMALDLARDHPKGLEHFAEFIEKDGEIGYRRHHPPATPIP